MGDMIEGIGDEVVLFLGFLVLSLIFLIYFSSWKRQATSSQAPPTSPTTPEEPSLRENHTQSRNEQTDLNRSNTTRPFGADGVRSRFHTESSGHGLDQDERTTTDDQDERTTTESGDTSGRGLDQDERTTTESGDTSGRDLDQDERTTTESGEHGLDQDERTTTESGDTSGRGLDQDERTTTESSDTSGRGLDGGSQDVRAENEITVRLIRAGGSGHAQEIHVDPDCTIDYLRRTYYQAELSQFCPVKFIYQGHVIEEDSLTLHHLNIGDGGAMHVHIGRPRPPGDDSEPPHPEILDLSPFFVPLFGVILGIVWVVMLTYPYIFTLMTKVFLFFLSFGYVVLAYVTTYGA